MKQSIPTIVITEHDSTAELLKLYLQEFDGFSFLAATSDYSKAYNGIKELTNSWKCKCCISMWYLSC